MQARTLSPLVAALILVSGPGLGASTMAATSVVSVVTSSVPGDATAEAVVTGPNAVIVVNGDRVEIRQGRLSVNGVPYGRVGERSVVTYRVSGRSKTLLVDGQERQPESTAGTRPLKQAQEQQ